MPWRQWLQRRSSSATARLLTPKTPRPMPYSPRKKLPHHAIPADPPKYTTLYETAKKKLKNVFTLDYLTYSLSLKSPAGILFWGFLTTHLILEHIASIRVCHGPSMLPTLNLTGDAVLILRWYRRGHAVKPGDLVSFVHPMHRHERAIKRVIGMPGDWVLRDTPGQGEGVLVQVPQGHCWVVGDNLGWSRDSRHYGPLPLALVRGRVVARLWPGGRWFGVEMKDLEPRSLTES